MQFACDAEPSSTAPSRRMRPRRLPAGQVERSGGISNDKDFVTVLNGRQRRKSDAHLGHDARDDQLLFSRRLDGLDEIFVVPGVDVARPCDVKEIPGNMALSSGTSGPLGPSLELVVRIVGSLKYFASSPRARTLFLK